MASDVVRKLARHWGEPLSARRGVSPEVLTEFEARYGVELPSPMRDYLLQFDGKGAAWPKDQDAKGFSFWPLDRIRPVNDELGALKMPLMDGVEHYFVFADFLSWLTAYAIRLDPDKPSWNSVVLIGNATPVIHVADSFEEFVDLYIENSPRLYGPQQSP